ncbi:MAG: cyclase family protein [Brockia lithotrophica]|nr:cyclase family protein [Brockia lithotrophica]
MRVYDVTRPVHPEMFTYKEKAEKRPRFTIVRDFTADGSGARETRLYLDAHTGTHLDAPLHMLPRGPAVHALNPERFFGLAYVVDFADREGRIDTEVLRERLHALVALPAATPSSEREEAWRGELRGTFILLRTRSSLVERFLWDFPYLAADGAEFLANLGVRGVGIDALGIERDQPGHPTHKTLLERGIAIYEGLNLAMVPEGVYAFFALPLPLVDVEASPVRAVLVDDPELVAYFSKRRGSFA